MWWDGPILYSAGLSIICCWHPICWRQRHGQMCKYIVNSRKGVDFLEDPGIGDLLPCQYTLVWTHWPWRWFLVIPCTPTWRLTGGGESEYVTNACCNHATMCNCWVVGHIFLLCELPTAVPRSITGKMEYLLVSQVVIAWGKCLIGEQVTQTQCLNLPKL